MAILNENYSFLVFACVINGLTAVAELSICFEMSLYFAKGLNAGAATISGFINLVSSLLAFVMVISLTPFLNNQQPVDVEITLIILFSILGTAMLLMTMAKSPESK